MIITIIIVMIISQMVFRNAVWLTLTTITPNIIVVTPSVIVRYMILKGSEIPECTETSVKTTSNGKAWLVRMTCFINLVRLNLR